MLEHRWSTASPADDAHLASSDDRAVTLVVPVRDEQASVPTLVRSIERQRRPPDHVIFVEAGSADGTPDLLATACTGHPTWSVLSLGPASPGRARNAGIEAAATSWVALTDAGVELDSHWLARLTHQADSTVDLVWGHVEPSPAGRAAAAAALVIVEPATTTTDGPIRAHRVKSCLIRKDLWRAAGRFPDLRAAEDQTFVRQVARLRPSVRFAPEAVAHWRIDEGLGDLFRKYRAYSRANVLAGEQRHWHHGVARMYLAALPFIVLAVARDRRWVRVPLAGFSARVLHNIWQRRAGRGLAWIVDPAQAVTVAVVMLAIDAATFAGWADALVGRWSREGRACCGGTPASPSGSTATRGRRG
jgi:glycosyltransferase involved in cell wall biosynthesis